MKALILAGGFGTRLRPLTNTRPKHLLPIANRPHIEHVLDLLERHGVTFAALLTSYLADAFTDVAATAAQRGMEVAVVREEEPLDTAGALKNAADLVADGTFVALNGDILTDLDLTALTDHHDKTGAEATIWLMAVDDPSAFGVVPTTPEGRILGFIEKPPPGTAPTNRVNAGVYVFEPEVLDRIPAGRRYSAERALFPEMAAQGARLFGAALEAYWLDVGTPDKYLRANMDALAGVYSTPLARPGDGILAAAGTRLAATAKISSAALGAHVVVESDASVERSVLLDGVHIGRGALVRDSVLGERARVSAGARVEGRVLADHEEL